MRRPSNRPAAAVRLALWGVSLSAVAATGVATAQDMPPAAQPGQCFGRARLPDAVSRTATRVLVRPAGVQRRMTPPMLRQVSQRVLAAPARTEPHVIPAVYRTVAHTVVTPGPERWVMVPARYRRVAERVRVSPAHDAWVSKTAVPAFAAPQPGQTELTATGEIVCRVRIPARYAERSRLVMIAPARRVRLPGVPVRRRVVEHVRVTPARTVSRTIPAVYRIERHTVTLRPGHAVTVRTPALYRDVVREHRVGREGWAQVVCPAGLAPWAMQRLQGGLTARGYDPGPADGQGRPQTYEALRRFQRDHALAEGPITVESARALGVVP